MHLTDESGVEESTGMDGVSTPLALLQRVSAGARQTAGAELALSSGTAQDGVWSATIQVPSTWDGQWQVTRVVASDTFGNKLDVDPRTQSQSASLRVTGTHQPALTLTFVPDPVLGDGRLTMQGRAYYVDTGAGIPDLGLFIGVDNTCVEGRNSPNATTNAAGLYSKTFSGNLNNALHCVGIPRPSNISRSPEYIAYQGAFPRVKYKVQASAGREALALGQKLTISGRVIPVLGGATVQLQQLVNGTWRTVRTSSATAGEFTLTITPEAAGQHSYRVYLPVREDDALSGVSRTLSVRVTSGDPGGDDGGLPVTGPALPPLVGAATGLMIAGAALMIVGRRRRGQRYDNPAAPTGTT
ncbi:hypothetical protein [Micromonospora echinofusca]|uniref:Ig-like domain (Group 3) n=1 Tax=Micromonospora echinofusca TaxID=47858 RepID=A0ABS3VMV7_MICEH|nr:hypothetical protein [Micromonospora echinofusca]MBO4205868.1 hypothetical protein [Micromonospora echinofusca]